MPGPHARDTVARFAHDLTEARREAGRSIRQVHRITGIPTATLGGYFSGRHLPPASRPQVLREVLSACGVPPAEHDAWRKRLLTLYAQRRQVAVSRTPYPGLRSFEAVDHDLFFGREELVERLLSMLDHVVVEPAPMLVVVGPSGSGKSSLLRAGLQAALTEAVCTVCRPSEVAHALTEPPDTDGTGPARVRQVLIVDQFEEVWTDHELRAGAEDLIDQLAGWSAGAPGRVLVLGLRADFYGEAMAQPQLAGALQHRQLLVEPPGEDALRAAIEGPARQVGLTLEPGLADLILADARVDTVGSVLPHLAHVLATMWTTSDQVGLTVENYRRAGGFAGAIRQSAEQALTSLPTDQQALAMSLLLRMVATAPAQGWTRRPAPLAELTELGGEAPEVLSHLVARRLVTVRADDATLSHESLVGAWPRLREAVEARRGDLARREALDRAAREWDTHGRGDDHLLRGSRLQGAADWVAGADEPLTPVQKDYLAASHQLAQHLAQTRLTAARRRRAVVAAMAVLLLLTTGASLTAVHSFDQARTERNQAQSRQMAVAAASQRDSNPSLSQQLAVAGHRAAPTRESRSAVLDATTSPVLAAWSRPDAVLEQTAALADGEHVLFSGPDGGIVVAGTTGAGTEAWQVVGRALLDDGPGTAGISRVVSHPTQPWAAAAGVFTVDDDPVPLPLLALLDLSDPASPVATWVDLPEADPELTARQPQPSSPPVPTALAYVGGGTVLLVADSHGRLLRYAVDGPAADGTRAGEPGIQAVLIDDGIDPAPVEAGVRVEGLSASADGGLVAAALSSGVVLLWQGEGAQLHPVAEHDTGRPLFALDVAPDGSAVAAVGRSGLVHWLELGHEGLQQTHGLFASDTNLFAVRIDPVGGLLVTSGWEGTTWMWRLGDDGPMTESPSLVLPVPRPVLGVEVASGRWIFTTLGGTVYTWERRSSVLPRMPGNVFLVGASEERERYMTATGPPDGAVTVWDASEPHTPVELHTLRSDGEDVGTGAGAISPDGRFVAMGTSAGRLLVWDVAGAAARPVVAADVVPEAVPLVMFAPGSDAVLAFGGQGLVRLVGLDDSSSPQDPGRGSEVEILGELELGGAVLGADMRGDGLLAISDTDDGVLLVHLEDLSTAVARIDPGSNAYGVSFHPDGDLLALSAADHSVRLYDVSDPTTPLEVGDPLTGPTSIPNSVTFSPDGQRMAVAAVGGRAWIYTLQEQRWVATEVLSAGLVNLQDVTWSPDGSVLLGGALAGRTRLWLTDVDTGAEWVCAGVGQHVTEEEWDGLLPGIDYAPPCAGTG